MRRERHSRGWQGGREVDSPRRGVEAGGLKQGRWRRSAGSPHLVLREMSKNSKVSKALLCVDQVCRYFPVVMIPCIPLPSRNAR